MSEEVKVPEFNFDLSQDDLPENDEQQNVDTEEDQFEDQQDIDESDQNEIEKESIEADENALAVYNIYKDQGIVSERDDFDGTFESLHRIIVEDADKQQQAIVEAIYNNVPEFARPLLQLAIDKGQNLTREEIQEVFSYTETPSFTKDDISDEDKAAEFMKQYRIKEGDTEEEAEEFIDLLRDRDKLTKEAAKTFDKEEKLRNELINTKVQEAAQLKKQQEEAQKQFQQNFVQSVSSLEWQDTRKQVVQNELFSGNFKTRIEHAMQNPAALAQLIDFMSYYDGESFHMDKYQKQAFSPTTDKVKKKVQQYWSGNKTKSVHADETGFDPNKFEFDIN